MRVIYNGVDLMAIETHEFSTEPVYDDSGTDYLYTRFSIYVTAVVTDIRIEQPNVSNNFMSYDFAGGIAGPSPRVVRPPAGATGRIVAGGGDGIDTGPSVTEPRPVVFPGTTVPLTHQAVRHRLSTPRGQLYVFSGGGFDVQNPLFGFNPPQPPDAELILTSPKIPYDTDCKNGPIPKKFDVTAAVGDTSLLLVDFAVETYVNEAEENNDRPFGALLSNRWKQRHSVDDDGYTVIVTEGLALFRTDFVYQLETSPDVDRPILFMPLMQGFRRKIDYVDTREDVTGIVYGYTDTQVPVNFVAGPFVGASQISAVHRQEVTSDMDPMGKVLELGERLLGLVANFGFARQALQKQPKTRTQPPPPPPPTP